FWIEVPYIPFTRLRCRGHMKNPGFNCRSFWLGSAVLFALAGAVLAEPPDPSTKKLVARPRPQVIYHLPSSSNSAATLHSQAKGQNNDLPIDSSMPTSLQISRSNANAGAAQAREQPVTSPPPEPRVKPPEVHRSQAVKAKGSSHSGPKKSHKR
ncbi:MAG: hypothetical protein M3N48_04280, partial [Verrucomicrobiota bacterium]|nr:hypothetical protein [Verrucomicrobiota bacterium]